MFVLCDVQYWDDCNIKWEPTDFGGIQVFEWPQSSKQLWTPDLTWIERYITNFLYYIYILIQ